MKLRIIILSALLVAALAALAARSLPPSVQVSLAFTINQRPRQETKDYAYDGYYALKAAELYADTLISWFNTPAFVVEVYRDAGVPLAEDRIMRVTDAFRPKKYSSQSVIVRYSAPDRRTAEALARAAADVIAKRTSELNQDSRGQSLFVVEAADPVITSNIFPPSRAAVIGLLLGALGGYVACYFVAQKEKSPFAKASGDGSSAHLSTSPQK